jgi:hypothetical protein
MVFLYNKEYNTKETISAKTCRKVEKDFLILASHRLKI